MNLDNLKNVWQSAANAPSAAETEQLKATFTGNLKRRHRLFVAFLAWVFTALSACTGLVLYNLFITHKATLARDWMILPLLAIPWWFAIRFLLQFREHRRDHSAHGDSIIATLRATLDENRMARSRAKRVGLIYLLGIPALALGIYQLHQSGKMSGSEVLSMLTVFATALGIAGGWTLFHYYHKLLPQKAGIESLLRQYESANDQP